MPSPFVNLILDFATETTLALVRTAVDAINAKIPAAPSTEGMQDVGNASLASIDGKLPSALASDRLKVDGSGVTQPVSDAGGSLTVDGAVTATQGTAAAANAPWYVRLSDGSAAISVALDATVSAMSAKLPAALGITTASESLSVAPASDALFDVKDRAARLLGALTGVNGSGVATGANPVPMQLSSGSALYTGASAATSLPIVFARSSPATSATLAINGEVIKASAGVALWITITNTTGSSVYWQIFDLASGPPANGARAAASAPAITANNGSRAGDLIGPTLGLGLSTGILLVLSLSPTTYSAVGSNSCSYSIQYI